MRLEKKKCSVELQIGMNEAATSDGVIRGVRNGSLYEFRGIKYGSAKRFEKAVRIPASGEIREAISYGAACPELSTPIPDIEYEDHPYYPIQSEDCLNLSIMTRSLDPDTKAPVIIFFSDLDYNRSDNLAHIRKEQQDPFIIGNAVTVSVNTRLNILGYLDLSEYGYIYKDSGNLGLSDRELAIEWIKENVVFFGGDPENIHIRISPKANPSVTVERSKEEALVMTRFLLEELELCNEKDPVSKLVSFSYDRLAEAGTNALIRAKTALGKALTFSPVKDEKICPGHPLAETTEGTLRGVKDENVFIFRGIRYAKSRRFHMPEAPEPWTGIKDALVYGPVSPEIETVNPDDNFTVPHVFYPQNENCQYLNIWTKSLSPKSRKPVLVWLHGGGFATGSGIEHFAYNGKSMCQKEDVVVVTLNHRLNLLGYLDLSAYGEEYKYSANVGTADIVEALRWIHRNIPSFGGDAANVTIFGQSGGGGKVAALLQTPSADGLFHKAVIQSGLARFPKPKADGKTIAEKILEKLNIQPAEIKKMESVPYHILAETVKEIDSRAGFAFGPVKDNDFYLGDAFEVGIRDHAKTIPVLVGNVLGEFSHNFVFSISETSPSGEAKNDWSEGKASAVIQKVFGPNTEKAVELQRKAYPGSPVQNVLFTDAMFRPATFDYLRLRAKTCRDNTYGYMFCKEMPPYKGILPWHNAEIPYVFGNAHFIEPSYIPGVTEKLEDLMCHAWCSFAGSGDPGWKSYDEKECTVMYFDNECKEKNSSPEEELVRFLEANPVKLTRILREEKPVMFGGGPWIRDH
ncbi:MAG: carboxylesterase family protein [Lachnospiraceae bacterium]|nr:carboxylesterase family protein [Lachnospiraceae bacterium]